MVEEKQEGGRILPPPPPGKIGLKPIILKSRKCFSISSRLLQCYLGFQKDRGYLQLNPEDPPCPCRNQWTNNPKKNTVIDCQRANFKSIGRVNQWANVAIARQQR